MPTNELIPYFEPGTRPTGRCTAAVRGKRIVSISATPTGGFTGTENMRIKECAGATEVPVGVAGYDGAIDEEIPVIALGSCMIVPLTVGAAVTAGELVMSDAQGRITPYVGPTATGGAAVPDLPIPIGVVLETQATVGNDAAVWLNR